MREALSLILATYYVALVGFFLVFVVWLGMGRYKNVRLGPDDQPPEFATLPWIAILFAAGTGVGLLFWSLAEPVMLVMVVGMVRALKDERFAPVPGQKHRLAEETWTGRDDVS